MAAHGRGTDRPVEASLFAESYRFDFYQAVKLLEILRPGGVPIGEGAEPAKEGVRFKSNVSMEFPASDVAEVTPPSDAGKPPGMTVNFLGLAGVHGPLPLPVTELLLERVSRKDTAFRDFLDIFNHRLVSLLYRVRKQHHLGLAFTPPAQNHVARYLFSLLGMGTEGLQGRMQVKDRALLFYTGLLLQQPRSMLGLESLLADYFHVPVKGHQFCGQWYPLEEDQVMSIGTSGRNQRLGNGAVIGNRIWDQQGRFELWLGPLTLKAFLDVLPIGRGFRPLCELTRFYVGQEFDFDVHLTLKAAEVPESRLSVVNGPRLGWTSWLKTREFPADDSQVRLRTRSLP
ncbi:MAG: type VI secretion system baseplate subunit TssG [Nitrospinae bacterium]|nr:type VI secretion system baseplate subunit TssG [Nitrospinota bacterium]